MKAIWDAMNGSKTALGGTLVSIGIALGILTAEDVEALNATLPVIVAGAGAAIQVIGLIHKVIKRARG